MKKLLFSVLILIASQIAYGQLSPQVQKFYDENLWTFIEKTQSGAYFYDPTTIKKDKSGYINFNLATTTSDGANLEKIERVQINCEKNEWSSSELITSNASSAYMPPIFIAQRTLLESIKDKLCGTGQGLFRGLYFIGSQVVNGETKFVYAFDNAVSSMPDSMKKTYIAIMYNSPKNIFEGKFNVLADCKNEKSALYASDTPAPLDGLPINKKTANLQYFLWDRACGDHGTYVKFSNK